MCCVVAGRTKVGMLGDSKHGLASELPQIAAPLISFISLTEPSDSTPATTPPHQSALYLDLQSPAHLGLDAEVAAAIAMPPHLPARPRLYQLSDKAILNATGITMLGLLTQLNLHGSALKKIEAMQCWHPLLHVMFDVILVYFSFGQVAASLSWGCQIDLACPAPVRTCTTYADNCCG